MEREIKVSVKEAHLPASIKGLCSQCSEDEYIILLRDELTDQEKEKAFIHEMLHIYRDDFSGHSVGEIESTAHCQV